MADHPLRNMTPAGMGWRAAAWMLDTSLALVPAWLVAQIATNGMRERLPQHIENLQQAQDYLQAWLQMALMQITWTVAMVVLIYGVGSVLGEGGAQQSTWGKRWLGLETTDLEGNALTPMHAGLRFLAGSLSWLTLNIGHGMVRFRQDRRALHDLVAHSRVWMDDMPHDKRMMRAIGAIAASCLLGLLPMWLGPSDPGLDQAWRMVASSLGAYM